jgi:hypothetical protein
VADDFDFPAAIDQFECWAGQTFFGGEAMPALMPNYGPDQWAGFLGARMTLVPENDTSWVEPLATGLDAMPELAIDLGNRWWKAIVDLTELAARNCQGKFILSTLDTHSNLDCLSALRSPGRLCMDLVERPEMVLHALERIDALYKPVYDTVAFSSSTLSLCLGSGPMRRARGPRQNATISSQATSSPGGWSAAASWQPIYRATTSSE